MNYFTIAPCEGLKDFVSHFWVSRLSTNEQGSFIYYSTANTNTELAFAFRPSYRHQAELVFSLVQGPTSGFGKFPAESFIDIFGASLYSHAIPSVFNVSVSELMNQFVDLNLLLDGIQGETLSEKVTDASTALDGIKILTDYFKLQLSKKRFEDRVMIKAMKEIRKYNGLVSINQLASVCCLSLKQFERRFTAYSGFKPKLYSRIIRFESAFWHYQHYDTFTEVAHAYGYYDQSHFIQDFKTFSGFTPRKFFLLTGH